MFVRRTLPLLVSAIFGIALILQFFVPHPASKSFYNMMLDWLIIVSAFTYLIAVQSTVELHVTKIKRRVEGWQYSIIVLVSLFVTAILGIFGGAFMPTTLWMKIFPSVKPSDTTPLMYTYLYMQMPMQSTIFSLLAFYMASAAFRSFRARSFDATLLLITAGIVTLGRVPLGEFIYKGLPDVVEWILKYPNMAAQRGILIGVQLGIIATSIKIILGIERKYLGGGK
ncbi:MAG: hypothetical protein ABIN00_04040 [candidate division WOR-3 bacterium]